MAAVRRKAAFIRLAVVHRLLACHAAPQLVGMDLCALRNMSALGPHELEMRPATCAAGAAASRCAAHREAIAQCPVLLSHASLVSSNASASHPNGSAAVETALRQKRWLAALAAASGLSVAVAGDSMARQAFMTLVARLRAQRYVLDYHGHHAVQLELFGAPTVHGRRWVVDALCLPTRLGVTDGMPARLEEWAARRAALLHSARADVRGEGSAAGARVTQLSLEFVWAPCAKDQQAAATHLAARGTWAHVVVFAPAYWHLSGRCGQQLGATPEETARTWAPWQQLNRRATRYTLVNAAVEDVDPVWRPNQTILNRALMDQYLAGAFPSNWCLFDWAELVQRLKPPTVVPHSEEHHSKHLVCQLHRFALASLSAGQYAPLVLSREGTGDCGDTGNTALWENILERPSCQTVSRILRSS
ncbi:hypothetical protein AB1Y20_018697 [Prymnesium parvum]|uniref:Uncharacterized protein n=1 Tax=Prymnesium parvum TaxID=97485 RepID=A0AB34JSI3_PRYPA